LENYSLDTHSLVWYIRGFSTLSPTAKDIIAKIYRGEANGFISTMVVLEAFYISLKHKTFAFSSFLEKIKRPNIRVIPFDNEVLVKTFELPAELDTHDRIIAATAVVTSTPLVTKDRILRASFPKFTIW
jgi:PIN domain nuclease of toxin-antitoxin system